MKRSVPVSTFALLILLVLLFPRPALAYIGPGAGLSALGAFLAIVAAMIIALFGFVWYPIKRVLRRWKTRPDRAAEQQYGETG